ncbi:hypothetical protein SADUNF_Sadunf01G0099400 [Salix dunnii]|uniref:K+ potassium transporter integral membrane domain-containing protein n=1 Tax=Salix dunnii TaxID=1413687 RepID=A0A835NBH0_9ROSI|nr:hypothetical protein SADUNF_Sadunf01G0099400 [Salix dunnii]
MMEGCSDSDEYSLYGQQTERSREALLDNNGNRTPSLADPTISSIDSIVQFKSPSEANLTVRLSGQRSSQTEVDDREFLNNCRDAGVVHIMGNTVVRARRDSRFYKKIAVDYIYAFLRKICRENSMILNVPHESLLNVGQIFYMERFTNELQRRMEPDIACFEEQANIRTEVFINIGENLARRGKSDEEIDYKSRIWVLDQNLDQPIDAEAEKLRNKYEDKKFSRLLLIQLAFQSLGVVYGDLGTSPLYVFYNTFPDGIEDLEDLIGALSLIIYSLTLIPLLKYVLIVCRANDNGQGGTFALYSLLCRQAKVKTIPNQDLKDEQLTTYSRSTFHETSFAGRTKRWLEEHPFRKNAFLVLALVGSSMVIGDGILAPAISVLSAVQGIKLDHPNMSSSVVVLVAVVILLGLFSMQHHGVDRVSWLFAPIVLLWFLLIGGIGLFNIWKYGTGVLKAISPVLLSQQLFFPAYFLPGQAAYLMKNTSHIVDAFYSFIPGDSIMSLNGHLHNNTAIVSSGFLSNVAKVNELEFLSVCRDAGVVHILGNTEVLALRDSKLYKKIAIDYIYAFLRNICRQNSAALNVPHESLLNVGQIIHV